MTSPLDNGHSPGERGLTERTVSATQWKFLAAIVGAVLHFGVGVVLARLLPPEDFGVLALALLFIGLGRLFSNLGLPQAVIQRDDLTERHVRVAFTLSLVLGLGIAVALFVFAPLSLLVFPEESQLPQVLRLISASFVLWGISNIAGALLERWLDFRAVFIVEIVSYVFGYAAVSVVLAVLGFGVYSLAAGFLAQALIEAICQLWLARHSLRPLFRRREAWHLTNYGMGISLGGVMNYVAKTGDNFVVGRWLGSHPLGLYSRAYGLMKLTHDYGASVVNKVLFPALSEAKADPRRLSRGYLRAVELIALLTFPVMAGVAVAAPHLIVGVYGQKWTGAIGPLQVLCLAGAFRAIYPLGASLANAAGRVYQVSFRSAVYGFLVIGGGILGSRWGIVGVSLAVVLAVFYMYGSMAALARKVVGFSWRTYLRSQSFGVIVAVLVAGPALGVRVLFQHLELGHLPTFVALVTTCGISYVSAVRWLPSRLRPTDLFQEASNAVDRLPAPWGAGVRFLLGV